MLTYKFGDIVLVEFPYSDASQRKQRPGLVLLDTSDGDIIVSRITSQLKESRHDIEIEFWESSGLKYPSIVRLHKIATLEISLINKILGNLNPTDMHKIQTAFKNLFIL